MKVSEITKNELVKVSQNYPDPYVRKMAIELLDRRGEKAVEHRHMIMRDDNCGAWVCGIAMERHEIKQLARWLEAVVFQWHVENAGMEAAKPASEGKAVLCETCAKGKLAPSDNHRCRVDFIQTECSSYFDGRKPTPPAKPDALDREIATEEYLNDEGKPEPVEPLPFLNDRTDDLPIVIRRMNLFLNVVNELHRKHDALEAVVRKSDDIAWVDLSSLEKITVMDSFRKLALAIEQTRHFLKELKKQTAGDESYFEKRIESLERSVREIKGGK